MSTISVIIGSNRNASQSAKVGDFLQKKLVANQNFDEVKWINLANTVLPMWAESYTDEQHQIMAEVKQQLQQSDAFVIVAPEWHGSVPSALKNFFLLYGANEFAHKPALLVGVSGSSGGSLPVSELRATTYKNTRICYIPEHLIIRDAAKVFNSDGDNDPRSHEYLSARADYALTILAQYSQALAEVRAALPDGSAFPNGMS
jgi:NAD(P)H-dependent FMN reductase